MPRVTELEDDELPEEPLVAEAAEEEPLVADAADDEPLVAEEAEEEPLVAELEELLVGEDTEDELLVAEDGAVGLVCEADDLPEAAEEDPEDLVTLVEEEPDALTRLRTTVLLFDSDEERVTSRPAVLPAPLVAVAALELVTLLDAVDVPLSAEPRVAVAALFEFPAVAAGTALS